MNIYAVIGVVAILMSGGAWWYLNQSNLFQKAESQQAVIEEIKQQDSSVITQETASSSNAEIQIIVGAGFEASIPVSWKVNEETAHYASLISSNYIAKSQQEIMQAELRGEIVGIVSQGAIIEVVPQRENSLSASVKDPAAYVQFHMEQKYSNEIENKQISLDGQPAWLLKTRKGDGTFMTTVKTVRNGKEFLITLHAASDNAIDASNWDAFLSNIKFR